MARRLTFGLTSDTAYRTKPLDLWQAKGRTAPVKLYVLPDPEFFAAAEKFGYARNIGAFAVWGRWWETDQIYLRASRLDLFPHEWRHIEEQRNFHKGDDT